MEDDLERPALSCHPCSERLPIVLSSPDTKPIIQVPASIAQYLRDYQRDGVRFLYQKFRDGQGGILADDMGLGKTIQALAFMSAVLQMKGTKEDKLRHCSDYIRNDLAPGVEVPSLSPVLIICPASLVENWYEELTMWAYFKVLKMTSNNRSDLVARARLNQYDVLIVSFETARPCIEYLNTVDWTCVFVDEVHRIKDSNAKLTKALNSLKCRFRYGLTGTPFQNNLKEVFCLLKWSNPQCINDADSNLISRLMEKGCRSSANKREATDSIRARRRFKDMLKHLVLRRTKEVLRKHLPSKTDQVVFCEPTKVQKDVYKILIQSPGIQNFLHGWKSKNGKDQKQHIFAYLNLLQKTANHVGLLAYGSKERTNTFSQSICHQTLMQLPYLENTPQEQWKEVLSDNKMSGKMLVLSKLLPEFIDQKDKVLIFSYSTQLLDIIEKHIVKERYTYCRLDGSTPADARCAMVRLYNTSEDVAIFLISTKAGGVGLNITGANVVILFDPNWNPALDLQAQDRAYRLGQKRDVRIYRLLTTFTIEEFVYLRQVYKQQLGSCSMTDKSVRRYFDGIKRDPTCHGELFGVKNLFSFCESNRCLTEELLIKQKTTEEKLLQKLKGKSGKQIPNASISECLLVNNKTEIVSKKSGLSELCEEVFGANDYDNFCNTTLCEEFPISNCNEEVEEGTTSKDRSRVLEGTCAVRHLFEHQDIVGPSVVEDFISVCAMRDVLEKRKHSQLPASHCFIESQKVDEERSLRSCSLFDMRMKFNKIAVAEFLTPRQLALKVMSLTKDEKHALLNKYQKRKHVTEEAACGSKRFRDPCSNSELPCSLKNCESTLPSPEKKILDVSVSLWKPDKLPSSSGGESILNLQEKINPDKFVLPISSEVSPDIFNVSKEASSLVDGLFFTKTSDSKFVKRPIKKPPDHPTLQNKLCQVNCPEVDKKTGCSLAALSLLDSLFFSNGENKRSTKKNSTDPKELNAECTNLSQEPFSSGALSLLNNSLLTDIFRKPSPKK